MKGTAKKDKKFNEPSLIDSELRYRRLFEAAQDGILILDAKTGMIEDVNPYLVKMLGYSREEFIKKKLWEVGAFKDIEASQDAFEALQQNKYIRYEDLPLKAKDGRLIQVEFVSNVYLVGDEKVIQCNIRDISEHKRIISLLTENEKKYHDLVNQSPDGIFIVDLSGKILTVNKAMCKELEFSEEELLSMNIWDIIPEEYLDQHKKRLTKILEGESLGDPAEYAVRGKSGKILYVEILSAPHYNGKRIIGFQGIAHDITERKLAEEALRESEEKYRSLVTEVSDGIFITDERGVLIFANPALARIHGYEHPDQLVGRNFGDFIAPHKLNEVARYLRLVVDGEQPQEAITIELVRPDGTLALVEVKASVRQDGGKVVGTHGVVRDITERKRTEAERQALLEIMQGVISTESLADFLELVRQSLAKVIYAENFFVVFYNKSNGLFEEVFAVDKYDSPMPPSKLERSITSYVFRTGKPLLATQAKFEELAARGEVELVGTPSAIWLGAPLMTPSETIGVIAIQNYEDPDCYSERDKEFLTFVGVQVSLALERRRAEEALRHSQEETTHANHLLLAFGQAAQVVQRARTPEEVYRSIQEQMSQLGYNVTVFELDDEKAGLRIAYLNYDSKLVRMAEKMTGLSMRDYRFRPVQEGIFQRVLTLGETVHVTDPAQAVVEALPKKLHALAKPSTKLFHLGPITFAPLTMDGKTFGILSVTGLSLSEADNPALAAFANQAAITIQNARLYEQIQNDITNRKQIEDKLEEERILLRTLIDNLPDRIFVKDVQGRKIISNNADWRASGGKTMEDVVGKTDLDIYPLELANKFWAVDKEVIGSGASIINHEEPGLDPQGNPVWVLSSKVPLRDGQGKIAGLVGIGRDITERKQREEEIRSRTDELTMLYQLSRALADANDLENVIEIVNHHAVENVHTTFACIALLEDGELVPRAVYPVRNMGHDLIIGDRQPVTALPVCQRVLDNNEPVIIKSGNPEVGSTERAILLLDFAQSICLVPLQVGDPSQHLNQALGLLILGEAREEKREMFTPEKVRLAHSIGDQAAAAIRRLLLREQAGRRLKHLASLSEIDRTIASNFDLHVSLEMILKHVSEQLETDAADVLIFNDRLQTLEFTAGRGFHFPAIEHKRLRLGEGQAGRAALERHIIQIPNVAASEAAFAKSEMMKAEQIAAYFAVPLITKGQVKGVLEVYHRTPLIPDEEWLDFLNTLAGQAAIAIDNIQLFDNLQRSTDELELAYDATIEGWSHALDLRDKETEGHTQRVTDMTVKLARAFGLSEAELAQVRWGALLHDIGKMGIPDGILLKPGPLTDEEWVLMKRHPMLAYEMLAPIRYLRAALDIPYCHHEKWDGMGYPRGLKGEQIPLAARLFAVVDVWDALRSDRPYRAGWPDEKVLDHIRVQAGTQFDPKAVELFFQVMGE